MWAAFVTPRWLEGGRFQSLLDFELERVGGATQADATQGSATRQSDHAVRTSRRTLSLLGRLPRSPWRNTCLYRSVAECILLRRAGISARVCLGVRKNATNAVNAHAWVETSTGIRLETSDDAEGNYVVLQRQWNTFAIVSDAALHVRAQMSVRSHVEVWLPFSAVEKQVEHATDSVTAGVTLRLTQSIPPQDVPAASTLRLGGVDAAVSESGDTVLLHSRSGIATGRINLHTKHAHIDVMADAQPSRHSDISAMLTLSSALIITRLNRALMHAAAVAPQDGNAWLLVGDTHSGKTTTTLNLVVAGWNYLSDDHVVLSRDANGISFVEGWPRTFHLDAGWRSGAPQDHRIDFDPRQFVDAHRPGCTKLGGVLFPVVAANESTRLIPVSSARALTAFVRQSPWLMADRDSARSTFALFTTMAQLPAYELRLGLDTFNNPTLLADRLASLTATS